MNVYVRTPKATVFHRDQTHCWASRLPLPPTDVPEGLRPCWRCWPFLADRSVYYASFSKSPLIKIGTSTDEMALQTEKNGTMVGKVVSKGPNAFDFLLSGAPKDAKPLAFLRQK